MSRGILDRYKKVLETEYQALISNDWTALSSIEKSKTDLFEELRMAQSTVDFSTLTPLLKRNQGLLTASQKGIRAAITRLAQITDSLTQSQVYGANGLVQDISEPSRQRVEKRS